MPKLRNSAYPEFLGFIALFVCIHLPWMIGRPLAAPDEIRYAEMAREMLASGDWVVPRLAGVVYLEKPPLGVWCGAIAQQLCGTSAFAVRLPAMLATLASACLLARFCLSVGASRAASWRSAKIFASLAFVHTLGTANSLDPLLSAFLFGAAIWFYAALGSATKQGALRRFLICGALLGAAFLIKGFVAFVLFGAGALPFSLLTKSIRRALWGAIPACAGATLIALPWSLLIAAQEPTFWPRFFWVEHIQRFFSSGDTQHREPFWFYLPILAGASVPWLAFAAVVIRESRDRWRTDRVLQFFFCWMVGPLLFLSASSGKLVPYLFPCLPACAGWIGRAIEVHSERSECAARGTKLALKCLACGVLILPVVWLVLELFVPSAGASLPQPFVWSIALWTLGAVGSGLCFLRASRSVTLLSAAAIAAWAFVPLSAAACLAFPEAREAWRMPQAVLQRNRAWLESGGAIAADYRIVVSLCLELQRTDVMVLNKPGELRGGIEAAESAGSKRLWELSDLQTSIREMPPGSLSIVCRAKLWKEWGVQLPEPSEVIFDGGVVFVRF